MRHGEERKAAADSVLGLGKEWSKWEGIRVEKIHLEPQPADGSDMTKRKKEETKGDV